MAVSKELVFKVGADPDGAIKAFSQISNAAKKEMGKVNDELADGESKGKQYARALGAMADEIETELDGAKRAAASLGEALGPELRAKLGQNGIDNIIRDARRAGLEFEDIERDAGDLAQAVRRLDKLSAKVEIEADADDAKGDIDRVEDGLRQLDGDTVKVKIDAQGAKDFADAIGGLPGPVGTIAGALGSGGSVVAGVGAIGAGLLAAAGHATNVALEAKTMSTLTGDTVGFASALQSVWRTSGADVNDLNDVVLQMNGVLKTNPELAKQLGVNLNDGKTIGQRFVEVVDKLGESNLNAADKAALMSSAFGEEGVRQVAALTTVIEGDLASAVDGVAEKNLVDDEDVERAGEMRQEIAELQADFSAAASELGQNMLPLLTRAAELAQAITAGLPGGDDAASPLNPVGRAQNIDKLIEEYGDVIEATYDAEESQRLWNEKVAESVSAARDAMVAVGLLTGVEKAFAIEADKTGEAVQVASIVQREAMKATAVEFGEALLAAEEYDRAVSSAEWGKSAFEGAATAMSAFTDEGFALGNIVQGQEDAWREFSGLVKESGLNLDTATEAGGRQQDALEAIGDTLDLQLSDAYVKAEGDGEKFRQSAQDISNTLKNRLQKELGLSEGEADELIRTLRLTPKDIETRYKLAGDEEAKIKLGLLQTSIDNLPKETRLKVENQIINGDYQGAVRTIQTYNNNHPTTVRTNSQGGDVAEGRNAVQRYNNNNPTTVRVNAVGGSGVGGTNRATAGGGQIRDGGQLTTVGEQGPELVSLPGGSVVHTAPATRRMLREGDGGDGVTLNISVSVAAPYGTNPDQFGRAVADAIAGHTRRNGNAWIKKLTDR